MLCRASKLMLIIFIVYQEESGDDATVNEEMNNEVKVQKTEMRPNG
jgi:hypothetical protein